MTTNHSSDLLECIHTELHADSCLIIDEVVRSNDTLRVTTTDGAEYHVTVKRVAGGAPKLNLREFIRTHFSGAEQGSEPFTARDVTGLLKAAGIKPKRGAVTDALWHMNRVEIYRVAALEKPCAGSPHRARASVATRYYSFQRTAKEG